MIRQALRTPVFAGPGIFAGAVCLAVTLGCDSPEITEVFQAAPQLIRDVSGGPERKADDPTLFQPRFPHRQDPFSIDVAANVQTDSIDISGIELKGFVDRDGPAALIRTVDPKDPSASILRMVRDGDQIGSVTVAEVDPPKLRLRTSESTQTIHLTGRRR